MANANPQNSAASSDTIEIDSATSTNANSQDSASASETLAWSNNPDAKLACATLTTGRREEWFAAINEFYSVKKGFIVKSTQQRGPTKCRLFKARKDVPKSKTLTYTVYDNGTILTGAHVGFL